MIEKTVKFIEKRGQDFDMRFLPSLYRLERDYQLSTGPVLHEGLKDFPGRVPDYFRPMCRIWDPGWNVSQFELNPASSYNEVTFKSLYCVLSAPDSVFVRKLDSLANTDGYGPPHAGLAWRWLKEKGCALPGIQDLPAWESRLKDRILDQLRKSPPPSDLGMECVAVLLELDMRKKIKRSWIKAIRNAQLPDGGWAEKPGKTRSTDHSTVLALWSVLAWNFRDRARLPWVPVQQD